MATKRKKLLDNTLSIFITNQATDSLSLVTTLVQNVPNETAGKSLHAFTPGKDCWFSTTQGTGHHPFNLCVILVAPESVYEQLTTRIRCKIDTGWKFGRSKKGVPMIPIAGLRQKFLVPLGGWSGRGGKSLARLGCENSPITKKLPHQDLAHLT